MEDSAMNHDNDPVEENRPSRGSNPFEESMRDNAAQESFDPEEYLKRYPELTTELKKLFQAVSMLPEDRQDDSDPHTPGAARKGGNILGDYKILKEIESGGMGSVYEAEQISLKRRVALKVLSPHLSLSHKAILKFNREAEAASRQNHPGTITIYEVGEAEGVYYIAQEFVPGGYTLAKRLKEFREGAERSADYFKNVAEIIALVADALESAHGAGVIHRDVKPSNILLTREGLPKLTDFGLAKIEDALAITRSRDFSGTPFYVSPEQAEPGPDGVDHRTDIYSLGVTLYEAMTLERPFSGKTSQEVLKKILTSEPKDPRKRSPLIPEDLSVICLKAMEKDPDRRYPNMEAFSEDLRRYLSGRPILAKPAGRIYKTVKWIQRHKLLSLAAAAVFVACISMALLVTSTIRQWIDERKALNQMYVLAREALGWDDLDRNGLPWSWYIWADPDRPGGYMIRSLFNVDRGHLALAIESLDSCIDRCTSQADMHLKEDALYLEAVIKLRLAREASDQGDKESWTQQALQSMDRIGPFDPFSQDALVWRHPHEDLEGEKKAYDLPIKLNRNHYLVHLYHGLNLFQILYKGGERADFEVAIRHLQSVLEVRPQNLIARAYLGRVQYFFARFYNYPRLLDEAERHLLTAVEETKGKPYHLFLTTLGQIALYKGAFDDALNYFQLAIDSGKMAKERNIHNAHIGIGKVYALQGRFDEAEAQYETALEIMPKDGYVKVSRAELLLAQGRYEEALSFAESALSYQLESWIWETRIASAYLACLRIHVLTEEYDKLDNDLYQIHRKAIRSPRDLSLACMMIACLPEEVLSENYGILKRRVLSLGDKAVFLNHDSPLCLSGQGAALYMNGRYPEALDRFNRAGRERAKWPDRLREYYWSDQARDLYYQAMAHAELAILKSGNLEQVALARACFDKAQSL
ncbi:MAG: protein kinase domain-containing protein [Planctomycetota bacterium]|jgi:tetratricopeptide (TPR) repeat protein